MKTPIIQIVFNGIILLAVAFNHLIQFIGSLFSQILRIRTKKNAILKGIFCLSGLRMHTVIHSDNAFATTVEKVLALNPHFQKKD